MTQTVQAPPQGIFSGIRNARRPLESEYVKPGHYWLRIDRCKVDKNRKGDEFCAIEMTVIRILDDMNGTAHRLGNSVSHLVMRRSEYFLGEIQAFVGNVLGLAPDQITEENAVEVFGPSQPLAGTVVEMHAHNVITTKNTDFTRISYKREVPAAELLQQLDPQVIERFFPHQVLEKLAAAEAQAK